AGQCAVVVPTGRGEPASQFTGSAGVTVTLYDTAVVVPVASIGPMLPGTVIAWPGASSQRIADAGAASVSAATKATTSFKIRVPRRRTAARRAGAARLRQGRDPSGGPSAIGPAACS